MPCNFQTILYSVENLNGHFTSFDMDRTYSRDIGNLNFGYLHWDENDLEFSLLRDWQPAESEDCGGDDATLFRGLGSRRNFT